MTAVVEKDNRAVALQMTDMVAMIERIAKDPQADVSKLEKILDLQERVFKREAEIQYNRAMQRVQETMPKIRRDKRNDQTNSNYATLESLNDAIVPTYTSAGFSLSFGTADCPTAGHFRVTCVASHVGGHSRSYQVDIPSDLNGLKGNANKTPTHAFGSSMSYARRYLTLLIFNLTLTDEDNDGNGYGDELELVDENQADTIDTLMTEANTDRLKFFFYLTEHLKVPVTKVEDIPANSYEFAVNCLNVKRRAAAKARK